jgi:hypothetical protein
MPYYDFLCPLNHITEKRLSFSEYSKQFEDINSEKIINCPQCRKIAKRIYSRPASCQINYKNGQRH